MSQITAINKIYKIYFTSFPYYNYIETNRVSNFALNGISCALIRSQQIFWISNIGSIYFVYNIRNTEFFYYNITIFFCCSMLYIISFTKVLYLIKYI